MQLRVLIRLLLGKAIPFGLNLCVVVRLGRLLLALLEPALERLVLAAPVAAVRAEQGRQKAHALTAAGIGGAVRIRPGSGGNT